MRDGEEQYRNRYPEAGRRSASSNYTGSTRTRNNNVQAAGRRSANSEITSGNKNETSTGNARTEQRVLRDETTTRRMASEATRNTIGNASAQRSNETERRPSAVTPSRNESRPVMRSEQNQNISSSRPASRPGQSQSVASSRPASRPEQSQSVASSRTASRPEQSQSVSPVRSSEKSRPESVSQERRSVENDKQVKGSNNNDKETKTGSAGADRRK